MKSSYTSIQSIHLYSLQPARLQNLEQLSAINADLYVKTVQATNPLEIQKTCGSIINTASFSGQAADLNRSGYNAAKGGVINFTRSTAIEYGRENIRANAIAPGTIETPLVDKLVGSAEDKAGQDFRENQKWVTPLGRLGKPSEVGKLVTFLASDDSSFITGETITIDGGVMSYTWPGEMLSDDSWKKSIK